MVENGVLGQTLITEIDCNLLGGCLRIAIVARVKLAVLDFSII